MLRKQGRVAEFRGRLYEIGKNQWKIMMLLPHEAVRQTQCSRLGMARPVPPPCLCPQFSTLSLQFSFIWIKRDFTILAVVRPTASPQLLTECCHVPTRERCGQPPLGAGWLIDGSSV